MAVQQQLQQKLQWKQTVFGLGFGLLVIASMGYFQLSDHPFAFLQSTPSSPSERMFDAAIPESERLELVKRFVAGDWYQPPIVDEDVAHTNYSFGADGSLQAWTCDRWGEMSERSYKPYDHDGAVHSWKVEAHRYPDSGKIVYAVIRGDGILWEYPLLLVERDKGFVEFLPKGSITKPLQRGHSTDCR